ncbi:ProQ/FINO family protein [Ensifer sp. ENS09]|uniref:ProQ/FINO family protein n=1 Tax=Ensifer sp. ENS09 TaxID=2769263 RepID=UPI00177B1AFA|nr:ProQ/FINO family protein [Ensifer sp. ENS09]MBD9653142.1 ProQ/FINO family protein [Ensifer sp. ENS09]
MGHIQPTIKSPRGSSSLVLAREREVAKTEAINALLIRPIAVLPSRVADPIRPFALGLWNEIRPLLKPDVSVSALRKALATYVHARSYQIAVARPGSMRHDIDGEPVEPVSDADRLDALKKYEGFKARNGSSVEASVSSLAASASKRDAISAHLLRRKDAPR